MANRLFIGNLPFNATENDLRNFFASYEVSDVKIIMDKDTGRSRGFGFVEVATPSEEVIAECDGQEFSGRRINVNPANERQPKQQRR